MNKLKELIKANKLDYNRKYKDGTIEKVVLEYVKICLEKAAEEAVVFLPTHYGLHGTHNVDKQSITNIELP